LPNEADGVLTIGENRIILIMCDILTRI